MIYDQSRMFRKMTAWFAFRNSWSEWEFRVVSVTQPMIGGDLRDPTNFLAEGSMALFNQIWALQTRQKVIEKMRFMANNGLHTGGKPALGYEVKVAAWSSVNRRPRSSEAFFPIMPPARLTVK